MNESTLDRIYAAAADDEALDRALREIADACGARAAGLFRIVDGRLDWERSVDMPSGFMDEYIEGVGADDPRTEYLQRYPARTVVPDTDPRVRESMQHQGVERFVDQYDVPFTTGVHLLRDQRQVWNLYCSHGRRQGPPDDAGLTAMRRRVPHFARSLKLRAANRALQQRLASESGGAGLSGRIMIDRQGNVRWCDAGADHILTIVGTIRVDAGQLRCRVPQCDTWFHQAQDSVRNRTCGEQPPPPLTVIAHDPPGRLTLGLLPVERSYAPKYPGPGSARDWHMITLDWLPRAALDSASNEVVLTPRQWEVLVLLAAGYSTTMIAGHLGCATSTARNHSQALLACFGVSNRIQMIERARRLGMID